METKSERRIVQQHAAETRNPLSPEAWMDKVQGCLVAGAAGDALGYPVEFDSYEEIQRKYGSEGIGAYELDPMSGKALVSDDTQMTLFTADAIIIGKTRAHYRGIGASAAGYAEHTYRDWLFTQDRRYQPMAPASWLLSVPELFSNRAPGMTCLNALGQRHLGTMERPINNSKGCGGVMRVAPAGLFFDSEQAARQAAELAALTHGHPLGYISAAAFAYLIRRCAFEVRADEEDRAQQFEQFVKDCRALLPEWFPDHPHAAAYQAQLLSNAVHLAKHPDPNPVQDIRQLGAGWVGEEALAIAVYACRRHIDDVGKAICVAVNHDGDSDSTGAICGNLMGALLGLGAIDESWTKNLELYDVIVEMGHDLAIGVVEEDAGNDVVRAWMDKYCGVYLGPLAVSGCE